MAVPIAADRPTAAMAIAKSSRAAVITREKMSRPRWSVPNQLAAEGGISTARRLVDSGSCGTT